MREGERTPSADTITVRVNGVAPNDAYLSASGIGRKRGPASLALSILMIEVKMCDILGASDLGDVVSTALASRLHLSLEALCLASQSR